MGSGNGSRASWGVKDPMEGVEDLAAQLLRKAVVECCVIGCDLDQGTNPTSTVCGATLGGFGLFGRVPQALETYPPIIRICTIRGQKWASSG